MGGKHTVSGTYSISSKLCFPTSASPNSSLIQILTHSVGFDKSYRGFFSSEYSYQDAAALADYTTFSYDRLGIGASSHPNPIQDVQAPSKLPSRSTHPKTPLGSHRLHIFLTCCRSRPFAWFGAHECPLPRCTLRI
jgi:hypothetical protein